MKNSLNQLKPKANQLKECVTSWHLAKASKNQELSSALLSMIQKKGLPDLIYKFVKIPRFKELLANMQEGKLYKKVDPVVIPLSKELHLDPSKDLLSSEDIPLPPTEVQHLQILVEAFHKLVHLSYRVKTDKSPLLSLSLLAENLLTHLSCVETLSLSEEMSPLTRDLLSKIDNLSMILTKIGAKHASLFAPEVLETLTAYQEASKLSQKREKIYDLLSYLSIDAKELEQNPSLVISNAHKVTNQIQIVLGEISLFYHRNLPYYIPYDIRKAVDLTSLDLDEFISSLFAKEKFRIIEAKEKSLEHKFCALFWKLESLQKSLLHLVRTYSSHLPESYLFHVEQVIQPLLFILDALKKPNPILAQLISGFFNTHYDHLNELLHHPEKTVPHHDLSSIFPDLLLFCEHYYALKPLAPFWLIRSTLEKSTSSMDDLKAALHLLIPTGSLSEVEPLFLKAFTPLYEEKLIPPSLFSRMDLPSFSANWYIFGEIVGFLSLYLDSKETHLAVLFSNFLTKNTSPFMKRLFS